MARPRTRRALSRLQFPVQPEIVPQPLTFFAPPRGMNTLSRLTRMPREYGALVRNLHLERGKLQSRNAVETFGAVAPGPLMHTQDFVTSFGQHVPVRFTTSAFQYFDGVAWITLTGGAIVGGELDFFTTTAWNDRLLFDNGQSGLHEYNPATGILRVIAAAPKSEHLTTFAGRVIASSVREPQYRPFRIKWSVKNNHEDWTGLGSGFEDLLSTPGGQIDAVMAVVPVTDDTALVVRTNSVWQMSVTGNPDAPFRFTLLFSKLGSESRRSIQPLPGGVIFLGKDDVYVVDRSGFQQIGEPVLNTLIHQSEVDRNQAHSEIIPHLQKYYVGVKEGTSPSWINRIWEYSFIDKGWVNHIYPFDIRTFAYTRYQIGSGIPIDSLVGTIDGLIGSIDSLGFTGDLFDGLYFSMAGTGRFTVRENPGRTQDVDNAGVSIDSGIELRTGVVHTDSPLAKIELIEAQVEYEAFVNQTLIFEYSNDGGTTWSAYATADVLPTGRPRVLRVVHGVATDSLMVRVRSNTLGQIILIALHLFVTRGALVRA